MPISTQLQAQIDAIQARLLPARAAISIHREAITAAIWHNSQMVSSARRCRIEVVTAPPPASLG